MLTTDERIVSGGGVFDDPSGGDSDTQVQRFFPDGSIDPSFQSPIFNFITTNPDIFQNVPQALVTQTNGSTVVGGGGHVSTNVTVFALARVLNTSALAANFFCQGSQNELIQADTFDLGALS